MLNCQAFVQFKLKKNLLWKGKVDFKVQVLMRKQLKGKIKFENEKKYESRINTKFQLAFKPQTLT